MRVLVTGSTGFIGRRLGVELTRRGHTLVCLVRDVAKARADLPFPAELLAWSGDETLSDIDAVVHLAGESIGGGRWTKERKAELLRSRVHTTEQLLIRLRSGTGRRPKVFVGASGVGYYGDRGDEPLVESSAPGKTFLGEVCVAWEAAENAARDFGMRVVSLRTGLVLGRHGGALAAMLPLFKNYLGGRLGDGRQWMSWIHLDDLVALYAQALEEDSWSGPLNAVSPHPVTNAKFTRALALALRVPAFLPAPSVALKLALGEMSALLLESQRVRESVSARGFRFRYERLTDALNAITKDVEKARGPFAFEEVSEQWVPAAPDTVFRFYNEPRSLERLSPPELHLRVTRQNTIQVREGSVVDYTLRAYGQTISCRSVVLDWIENQRFSTTHQRGPFRFWFHTHRFERLAGGTLITERVIYRARLGMIGAWCSQAALAKRIANIFRYRRARVAEGLPAEAGRAAG